MKAMFCFSKAIPRMTATPSTMVVMRETRSSEGGIGIALLEHGGVQVVGHGRGAGQGQTGNHGQDGGEGHGGDEAEEQVAADSVGRGG